MIVLLAIALTACGSQPKEIVYVTPPAPEIPADIQACAQQPTNLPEQQLSDGEVERFWKTDRARLVKLGGCFQRLICSIADYRREISKVDEKLCEGQNEQEKR